MARPTVIHSQERGLNGADGDLTTATANTLYGSKSTVDRLNSRVFDVTDPAYGAVGNGVADDSAAVRLAYAAAVSAGGGKIFFPFGTYLCNTALSASSHQAIVFITADNIEFDGDPGTIIRTTQDISIFGIWGMGKTAGYAAWLTNEYVDATVYTLSTATVNSRTLTLATAAQAGNFAANDWIFVRTGQVLELTGNTHPDAELNQVVSANAGTGVITLRWPLAKTYLQEAIDTPTFTYRSKVGGAGANVPFGVSKVTDRTLQNITIHNLILENPSTSTRAPILGGQAYHVTIDDNEITTGDSAISPGNIRWCSQRRNRVRLTDPSNNNMAVGCAVGMIDAWIEDNDISGVTFAHIPVNEGSTNVWVQRNTVRNDDSAPAGTSHIPIQTRARNVNVLDNKLYGDSGDAAIFVSSEAAPGGVIARNYVEATDDAIVVASGRANGVLWTVADNDTPNGNQQFYAPVDAKGSTRQGFVTKDAQTVDIGWIPGTFMVTKVTVYVDEAFNSDGNDFFYLGWDEFPVDPDSYGLVNGLDVGTAGIKTVTLGTNANVPIDTGKTLNAIVTNSGSTQTTGKLRVVAEYVPVSRLA